MGAQHVESDGESSITNPRQASGPARGVFAKTWVICATASAVAAWAPHFMAHPDANDVAGRPLTRASSI